MKKDDKLPLPAQKIIEKLSLEKSDEGVYVKTIYKSTDCFVQDDKRFAATNAYVLTTFDAPSRLHRLDCDEIWHFYSGNTIDVFLLFDEKVEKISFGSNFLAGEQPKIVISKGTIFGALVKNVEDWCLFGCTCVPGFTKAGFELIEINSSLLKKFSGYEEALAKLT